MNSYYLYVGGKCATTVGLDAIQKLFYSIPNNTGLSFVLVHHLSPDFKSLMPELLAKHPEINIFTAEDKQQINLLGRISFSKLFRNGCKMNGTFFIC